MSIWWTIMCYSLLSPVKALIYTGEDSILTTCYMDTFDPCFTSQGDNFTIPDGDLNIVAILAGEGESKDECIGNVLHSVINIEYAIEEAAQLFHLRSNTSITDYAIIHSCFCNGSSLQTDHIFALLQNIQNPVVILGANFPPLYEYAILEITESLNIAVYSLSSSYYVTEFQSRNQHSVFTLGASHEALIEAVVKVVDHFGWSWVSFTSTDDEMGRTLMSTAEMRLERIDSICLDAKILVKKHLTEDHVSDERLQIVTKIQNSTAKVFVTFVEDLNSVGMLDEIVAMFSDRVWILASLDSRHRELAGDAWTIHISPTSYLLPESLDDFLIDWCSSRSNCSSRGHRWGHQASAICQGLKNGSMDELSREVERVNLYMAVRMIKDYVICGSLGNVNLSCSSTSSFNNLVTRELLPLTNRTHPINRFSGQFEVDMRMSALPWGFDIRAGRIASASEIGTNDGGSILMGRFRESGPSSEIIFINDGHVIWPVGRGKIPESRCSADCPSSHTRFSLPGQPACCFVCLYCEGSLNHTSDGSMRCEQCPKRYWFNLTSGSCEPRYLDYLRWDSIPSLVYIVICTISILVNIILLGIIAYHHASPIVKAANRELSLLLLLGTIVSLVAPILHIGLPTPEHCMIHVGLQGPMISLVGSVYLVKTKGVLSIFEAKLPDLMHRHLFLQRHLQLLAVFVIVLIEAVAVMLYLLFKPPGVLYIDSHIPHITYVECNYGLVALPVQWLYNWVIVAVAFVLAFRARHLPENFGEARLIASSMGCCLLVWLLSFMCFVLSSGSLKAIFQNAVLVACPWIFMGFLYFPKCYIILKQPHRNTVQEIRRMTLAHVQRKADQVCESSASRRASQPDVQKQTQGESSYKEKPKSMQMSSLERVSGVKDDRIVLQINAPDVSGQGTDETAISSSDSVSSSSNRSPRNSVERDPVISLISNSTMEPPIADLENDLHGSECAPSYVQGITSNSNSYHNDAVNDNETRRTVTEGTENPETSPRNAVKQPSAHQLSSFSGVPDRHVISIPCDLPHGNCEKTDVFVVVTSSPDLGFNTNDTMNGGKSISSGKKSDQVDFGQKESISEVTINLCD